MVATIYIMIIEIYCVRSQSVWTSFINILYTLFMIVLTALCVLAEGWGLCSLCVCCVLCGDCDVIFNALVSTAYHHRWARMDGFFFCVTAPKYNVQMVRFRIPGPSNAGAIIFESGEYLLIDGNSTRATARIVPYFILPYQYIHSILERIFNLITF